MKKLLATVALVLGVTGIIATAAPPASAQLACVDLYLRIGETVILDNEEICV